MGGDEVRLPLSYVQDRELVITGAFLYANTWPTAIRLAGEGRVKLDPLVTATMDWTRWKRRSRRHVKTPPP